MKISVISATYERGALLRRALETYLRQTLPFEEWEYLLVDDASTDNTQEVVQEFQTRGLPIRVFDSAHDLNRPKEPGVWRDGCVLRNAVSRHAEGEVLISTHPEILVPPTALERAYQTLQDAPGVWATAVPYFLPPDPLEGVFDPDQLLTLHTLPRFASLEWNGGVHNNHSNIDFTSSHQSHRSDWESEVWWGMTLAQWRQMRGFREFEQWGSVDMDFLMRRKALGIPTVLIKDPASEAASGHLMVYHQYHNEGKRDVPLALAGVAGMDYPTPQSAIEVGGL